MLGGDNAALLSSSIVINEQIQSGSCYLGMIRTLAELGDPLASRRQHHYVGGSSRFTL